MPYIPADFRERLRLDPTDIQTCGCLNYMLTRAGLAYIHINGKNYQTLQDVVSATFASADHVRHGTLPKHGDTARGRLIDEFYRVCRLAMDKVGSDITVEDVEGCLCCMRHEWIRRLMSPYEDLKIAMNGDIFPT